MKYEKRIGSQTPITEWFIPLPVGATFVDVVQIYDSHRNPSDIEYRQDVIDGYLKVDFMLEAWSGFVEFKYETNPDDEVDLPEWLEDAVTDIVDDGHHHHDDDDHHHHHTAEVDIIDGEIVIRIRGL